MVEQLFQAVRIQAASPEQIEQHARIEIAAARTHWDAAGRREPHAGIDRTPILKAVRLQPLPR